MPLYEYECEACGHRFELIQKFSDPPIERCPKCGSAVHKLQSAPAFHLKGSGWYATDYAKKDTSGGDSKPAASEKPKSSETKESPKTETATPASTSTPATSSTSKTGS